jgi:hypothetical protein
MMNRAYYAVIPASVRYDKRLIPNAKLLYGEITALSNETGYCWATNNYFSELYRVSKKSISLWVKSLADCGYIKIEMEYRPGSKEILHRYIRLCVDPMEEKVTTPTEEKVKENITGINTTLNNTILFKPKKYSESFESFWSLYPKKVSKGQAERTYGAMMKRGVEPDSILSCLQNYLDEIRKTGKEYQFIKNPGTFLNNYLDYENPVPVAENGKRVGFHEQTSEERMEMIAAAARQLDEEGL